MADKKKFDFKKIKEHAQDLRLNITNIVLLRPPLCASREGDKGGEYMRSNRGGQGVSPCDSSEGTGG